jgi:hypothetical protein
MIGLVIPSWGCWRAATKVSVEHAKEITKIAVSQSPTRSVSTGFQPVAVQALRGAE